MFLIRGILWLSCFAWVGLIVEAVGGESVAPNSTYVAWILLAAIASYVICFVYWVVKPGHSIWKETIALGIVLLFPFVVPGVVLLVIGLVGGVRAWRRKRREPIVLPS